MNENHEDLDIKVAVEDKKFENEKILKLESEVAEYKNKILYLMADVENVRRNAQKEILSESNKKSIKIIAEILNVYDNFEKFINFEKDLKHESEGMFLIYRSFETALKNIGVEKIDFNNGFDPVNHEAIAFLDAEGKKSGEIIEVARNGYKFRNIIIRPAQVVVAK